MVGQTVPAGPPLDQTIAFMDAMLKVEDDSFEQPTPCFVVALQRSTYVYGLPEDYHIVETDSKGVGHYGFSWQMYKREPTVLQFPLGDIDPTTIVSAGVASITFIKEHRMGENLADLDNPDRTFVHFQTSNAKASLKYAAWPAAKGPKTEITGWNTSTNDMIFFRSRDRAERFVTAFRHAVTLCGGHESDFAPTKGLR